RSFIMRGLVEGLHADQTRTVVVSNPEGHRSGLVVHLNAPKIGAVWQEIFRGFPTLFIDAHNAVVGHSTRPDVSVLIKDRIIGIGVWRGYRPFLEVTATCIKHCNLVCCELCEPKTVLGVEPAAPWTRSWCGGRNQSHLSGLRIHAHKIPIRNIHTINIVPRICCYAVHAMGLPVVESFIR